MTPVEQYDWLGVSGSADKVAHISPIPIETELSSTTRAAMSFVPDPESKIPKPKPDFTSSWSHLYTTKPTIIQLPLLNVEMVRRHIKGVTGPETKTRVFSGLNAAS
jgi:hypothetical protein